jgi:amino acid transporter
MRARSDLSVPQGVAVVVGIVVGVGIFKAPSVVAGGAESVVGIIALWIAGALISIVGALCYAELASAYPHRGGEYHFLSRAFGRDLAFLFAWGRLTIVQTGAIAAVAFVFGDYAARILPLGAWGPSVYGAAGIVLFSAVNGAGASPTRRLQSGLALLTILALVVIAVACFYAEPRQAQAPSAGGSLGLAMVFVLLAYGGWNEAAYLSADVRNAAHGVPRILLIGIAVIAGCYVLLNLAYLRVLGIEGVRASDAVAADAMAAALGPTGELVISVVIAAAALSTLNATIYTGARSSYAVGLDFARLHSLSDWDARRGSPRRALILQAYVALALVVFGSVTRDGFETMVELTSPVFWVFFLLTGVSLLVLRRRDPGAFALRVPLFPLVPLLFCGSCAYMLYSSIAYTGIGATVGLSMLAAGLPVLLWARYEPKRRRKKTRPSSANQSSVLPSG